MTRRRRKRVREVLGVVEGAVGGGAEVAVEGVGRIMGGGRGCLVASPERTDMSW